MNQVLSLAPRLAVARMRGARAGATLDVLAVVTFAVSSFLALTVVGGTWMFITRFQEAPQSVLTAMALDPEWADNQLQVYVVLAAIACALLVLPVLGLGAAAARLGARGRSRRLASMRLVGMTGGEVVSLSVLETLVQAAAGTIVGGALWLLSLPLWQAVSFQGVPIGATEMLVPLWLGLATVAGLLALAALSTVVGLQRVRISPLGVAAQQVPPRLKAWRLVIMVAAVLAFALVSQSFGDAVAASELFGYAFLVGMMLVVIGALNLVGPWVLQLVARPLARTSSVPRLLAARRIVDDPRAAWRNVSSVALLGMIAAFAALLPSDADSLGADRASLIMATDMRTGVVITLAVGLVVAATSTLVNQASTVVDRAEESVAMDRAGTPRPVFAALRRHQVLVPLVVTLAISIGVGVLLSVPFLAFSRPSATGILVVLATVVLGVLLTLLSAEACRPLQSTVLGDQRRRND
ncbi:FtsX-like permease family protein [Georgenia sp. Z1491]|uniref:FtsX-like permease family protein n=1 Tax=Georgenia sp. Z1491 TaxID=3416707 RepID=UPI003CFB57C4